MAVPAPAGRQPGEKKRGAPGRRSGPDFYGTSLAGRLGFVGDICLHLLAKGMDIDRLGDIA